MLGNWPKQLLKILIPLDYSIFAARLSDLESLVSPSRCVATVD